MEKDPLCPMCGSELASGPEAAGEEDAQEGAAANPGDGQHRGDSALTALERTLGEMFEDQAMGMDERAPERPDRAWTVSAAVLRIDGSLALAPQWIRSKYSI